MIKYLKRYKASIFNMGYYFLASIIPMAISLVCSPIFSSFLSAQDFAIIGFYASFATLFSPLILFYLNQYYLREFFYRDDRGKLELRAMIFKIFVVFPFLIMSICILGLYIYMHFFNSESEMPFMPYVLLALLPSALAGLYRLELIDYKVNRKGKSYFVISIVNDVVIVVLSLLFVVLLKWGAFGKLLGAVSCPLFIFIWSAVRHRDLFKVKVDLKQYKEAFVFCLPLVFAAMLGFFSSGYDRVCLEKAVKIEELGLYSVGITIAGYLGVFSGAIGNTFAPDIFESLACKDNKRLFKIIGMQFAVMIAIVGSFILLAKPVVWLLTAGQYIESVPFARIASIGTLTAMLYSFVSNVVLSYKKTRILLYTKILGSVACVFTYSFLISHFGSYGAVWGVVLSNIFFAIIAFVLFWFTIKHANK